jgi:type IV pilus assembly protein PilC
MTSESPSLSSGSKQQLFHYEAQAPGGEALSGELMAESAARARLLLDEANLRVLTLEAQPATRGKRLTGMDFLAFNQQLAQLTAVGLPVHSGLRLIAADMRSSRLQRSVQAVADDLESGRSLSEAFERHRDQFPPLYAQLIAAGVKANRLPDVLMNLGRHLELVHRVRTSIWRAAAYPMVVLGALLLVLLFLGVYIVPTFAEIFEDFDTVLPWLTSLVVRAADFTIPVVGTLLGLVLLVPLLAVVAQLTGTGAWMTDHLAMRLPLIGPVLRRNVAARWANALQLGVRAGLDLPRAIDLAGDTVQSLRAQEDGQKLARTIAEGRSISDHPPLDVLPAAVPAAIELGSRRHDLAALLGDIAVMYEQQTQLRLAAMEAMLGPILLIFIGCLIGTVVMALFMPLVALTQAVM